MYSRNVICVLLLGLWVESSESAKDKLHIKVKVPDLVHKHTHTKYVYLHDKKEPKKMHHHKGKAKYQFSPFSYNYQPFFNDGYSKAKSWKTLRSEKYETETVSNPHSDYPGNKYIVKSNYKVREKLPYEDTTIGYDREFQYPSADIESDYHKNEKLVDYENQKHDPFPKSGKLQGKKNGPKEYYYIYKGPAPEYDYYKNDNDFFPLEHIQEFEKDAPKEKKKPKEVQYSYKVPSSDYDFHKSVQLVDYYLKKNNNNPDFSSAPLQEEPKNTYNDVDYEVAKNENSHFDPSIEYEFEKYKTDPEYDHLDEYGDF
ncbi:uncharacterized protein LOC103314864 [Tribolium castaneum]|uniref:Uncharacterized protein n=1 Tax=Tribolium castaneum TaxID=7070 RepID=D7EJG0_TRICA|nr:PREDICTED: uncharacterized protein LOC103314864 [Tribolium castaneum]EFA12728.1 hypothetical protein TcasGA2_TC002363 [Tribolium castaneum]|eukprot:XP_008200203.1 PREDICTED: uncharacterized protein LOC103314864 [Tribolium castaneum]